MVKRCKLLLLKLWRDESGQGTAEYVLILVAIVAVGIIFRKQITELFTNKMGEVKNLIMGFGTSN